jgi:ATP-binding cassette, subfamily B (MDR/TAP), member 7
VATAGKLADDKVQKDISKKDVDHQIADTQILKNLGKYLLLNETSASGLCCHWAS